MRTSKAGFVPTGAPSFEAGGPPWYAVAALLAGALLVQSTLAPFLSLRGAALPLVPLIAFWFAVRTGVARGCAFGLLAGACEDALGGGAPGWTFAGGVVGAVAGRIHGTQLAESRGWLIAAATFLTALRYGIFSLVEQLTGRAPLLETAHFHTALWQAALAGVLAALLLTFVPEARGTREYRL